MKRLDINDNALPKWCNSWPLRASCKLLYCLVDHTVWSRLVPEELRTSQLRRLDKTLNLYIIIMSFEPRDTRSQIGWGFLLQVCKERNWVSEGSDLPKAAGHKDGKKWPAIPIFVLSMCLFMLHLLALLFWWRGGHPELKLGSGGTDAVGSGQSRLSKLCPGCLLAQMGIHKGEGKGLSGHGSAIVRRGSKKDWLTLHHSVLGWS